jgi:hypothetical protein
MRNAVPGTSATVSLTAKLSAAALPSDTTSRARGSLLMPCQVSTDRIWILLSSATSLTHTSSSGGVVASVTGDGAVIGPSPKAAEAPAAAPPPSA